MMLMTTWRMMGIQFFTITKSFHFNGFPFIFDYCRIFSTIFFTIPTQPNFHSFPFFLCVGFSSIYQKNVYVCFFYYNILLCALFFCSKKSTYARMISIEPGSLLIIGSFKKQTVDPDFKVSASNIIFSFSSPSLIHQWLKRN